MHPRQAWQDAHDAQLSLWRWLKSDNGISFLGRKFKGEVQDESWDSNLKELLLDLYVQEPKKVRAASLFFVSDGMCDVVEAAKTSFEPEPIFPTDFLAPIGFLYFERPIVILDRYGEDVLVRGFAWAPIIGADNEDDLEHPVPWDSNPMGFLVDHAKAGNWDGMGLTLYSEPRSDWEEDDLGPRPAMIPGHLTPWWYDETFEGNEVDQQGRQTAAEQWWKIVQTTLRLMQQRLAVRHQQQATRAERRESERSGFGSRDVTVIRLRREQSETPEGHIPSPANYSHRFIVGFHDGGFWRQQHYPGLGPAKLADGSSDPNTHRQIWIAPFEKGPKGAPLVIKPRRVYTWTR